MREREEGTVLVTVLAVVALASAVLVTMVTTQETAIARSQRYSEAAQALEIARGGEASVVAALRRDGREAPQIDHYGEAWASVQDREQAIENGTFTLTVEDMQGRFNLTGGGVIFADTVRRIVARAAPGVDLDAVLGDDPATMLALARSVDPGLAERIAPFVVRLPVTTDININAASETLLAALLQNPVAARRIARSRDRQGYVTGADIRQLGVVLPRGMGLTSNFFRVTTTVRLGRTTQRLESLLHRRRDGGSVVVDIVSRRRSPTP